MNTYVYALFVIDPGSGSTPKGSSQTPETMGWMNHYCKCHTPINWI